MFQYLNSFPKVKSSLNNSDQLFNELDNNNMSKIESVSNGQENESALSLIGDSFNFFWPGVEMDKLSEYEEEPEQIFIIGEDKKKQEFINNNTFEEQKSVLLQPYPIEEIKNEKPNEKDLFNFDNLSNNDFNEDTPEGLFENSIFGFDEKNKLSNKSGILNLDNNSSFSKFIQNPVWLFDFVEMKNEQEENYSNIKKNDPIFIIENNKPINKEVKEEKKIEFFIGKKRAKPDSDIIEEEKQVNIKKTEKKEETEEEKNKDIIINKKTDKNSKNNLNPKKFICECGKIFKTDENRKLHYMNIHLHLKPYQCDYCNTKFTHRTGKIYHERIYHTFILPYICETCQTSFASKSALIYHVKAKHKGITL